MKLMTKETASKLPKMRETESVKDPIVHVKYFNPVGRGNWFGIEYDEESRQFFGYVSLFGDFNDELGYFSLDELESINLPFGMKIERDLHWTPKPLSEVKKEYTR